MRHTVCALVTAVQMCPLPISPCAFGENISTSGLDEQIVFLGDRFRLGSALVEVTHARQPCWKLDHRFGAKGVMAQVVKTRRTGWYYRVIEPGAARAGDARSEAHTSELAPLMSSSSAVFSSKNKTHSGRLSTPECPH